MDQPTVNRRTFVATAAMAAAVAAVPARAAESRLEMTRVTIAVGGKAALYYLPLTVADQLGYFAAEGLEVQISDHADSAQALQSVARGAADVVSGAYEHTIKLQARGLNFQAFVLQGRAPQITLGVSTRSLPQFRSLADLKGRRIGITGPGSSTSLMTRLVLSRVGLQAGDVSLVGVGTSAGALAAGLMDDDVRSAVGTAVRRIIVRVHDRVAHADAAAGRAARVDRGADGGRHAVPHRAVRRAEELLALAHVHEARRPSGEVAGVGGEDRVGRQRLRVDGDGDPCLLHEPGGRQPLARHPSWPDRCPRRAGRW